MKEKNDITIGRFRVEGVLGEGGQGIVYLAHDPHLEREVAIKVLASGSEIGTLLEEARIVSRMQHPNIVTLYDAGEYEGKPYLVFEYVKGKTLSRLIRDEGTIPRNRAVQIALQILEGIRQAHGRNILHRDIKPANIIIDSDSVARIMDFGIATSLVDNPLDSPLLGSPLYMAPECIRGQAAGPRSDLFSIGMVLYEMLAGSHPVKGGTVDEILQKMSGSEVPPPSQSNPQVDERLDSIVLKALAIDPENRFQDAESFISTLKSYLEPEVALAATDSQKQSTLEFLLRRIRHKSDFPALSQAISAINRIAHSEDENVSAFSNVILKDFSLTNKLLKLVNAALYSQFGGSITTVSRAVVILGFQRVRSVAIGLMLFEHLQNKAQAAKLKEEVIANFYSGVLARELAGKFGLWNMEEVFICAMFHNLGKLLATFYFHEEMLEIEKTMAQRSLSDEDASAAVLGITFEELGIGIAKSWNFPEKIVQSMRRLGGDKVRRPDTEVARLRLLSSLSSELCGIVGRAGEEKAKGRQLDELVRRFGAALPLSAKMLNQAIDESLSKFLQEARILEINTGQSDFLQQLEKWSRKDVARIEELQIEALRIDTEEAFQNTIRIDANLDSLEQREELQDSREILVSGIQEITNTLVDQYALNDLLRMVLETMYRGMDFSRAVFCIKDARLNQMVAKFGFGAKIEEVTKRFNFPLGKSNGSDIFQFAMEKGVDIFIKDVDADNIRERIPTWYRASVCAKSFILFPILIDKKPVGLIYGDQIEEDALKIEHKHLTLLKTLRNQAVLAIKQQL